MNAHLQVTETQGGVQVDTGAALFEFSHSGSVRAMRIAEQRVVADNAAPLFFATLLESQQYDGWRDSAPARFLDAVYQPRGHAYQRDDTMFRATFTGRLEFPGGDSIACQTTVTANSGSPFLMISANLTPEGRFQNRFLRQVGLRLPLSLNKRKRVVQAGDRGVQWDTRHFYQFHHHVGLLPEPDHNIWRTFAIDQHTANDYHIWRSESTATSPLSMQRGIAAPGWMAVYDQQKGLLFAYRGFRERAPKSLRIEADGSGVATIYLYSPTEPALDFAAPGAAVVFGVEHTTDWLPFVGEFPDVRPDQALAKHWGVEQLASDPPARNEIPAEGLPRLDAPAADAEAPLVSGSVPLPKGALRDPKQVCLRRDGVPLPVQTLPVAFWPDGSIKWLLLTFPPDGGRVEGSAGGDQAVRFFLTRRDGSKTPYHLEYGGGARPGQPAKTLTAVREGNRVRLHTGPLEVEVASGTPWIRSVRLNGREMLDRAGVRSFVDFLRPEKGYDVMTTHAQGAHDPGEFVPESVELEEAGPLRAVVRLEGMTTSREPTRVIVRLEAYAGRSTLRLFHSAEFLHKDPRQAFVRRMGLDVDVASPEGWHASVGGQDGALLLPDSVRCGIRQHSHLGYRAWHQVGGERFVRTHEVKHRGHGWLDASGLQGGVAVALRDMWQQFPNELVFDRETRRVRVDFWPESVPVMDVRRYSNYPHVSQGESAERASSWVSESWYRRDPFVGVSKTHEVLLYFHGPQITPSQVDAVAADFQSPPLVYPDPQATHDARVLPAHTVVDRERFPRAEANLEHVSRFYRHHQQLWGWYGFWDYGDIQHYFQGGYGTVVLPDALARILAEHRDNLAGVEVPRDALRLDYTPNHDWAFDNGRWGWTNTEGLPNLFMQIQYLRTGDRDLYFFLEAMARHVRDVDMRHDGMWLGQGTRHGVQHWSDGNHEERQTTHSEFRYYYYMSGDRRCRDFARLLYERVYSQRSLKVHAAHSGRLQGLLTWWEMTGSPEVGALLEKYVPAFCLPQGIGESPQVEFPGARLVQPGTDVNTGNMFWWTFGAGHGVLEYYDLTGNEAVKQALIAAADHVLQRDDPGNLRKALFFAAKYAPNPEPYRRYIEEWLKRGGYRPFLQMVVHNPAFYTGPRAIGRGPVCAPFFFMNDAFQLMDLLPGDPPLTEWQAAALRRVDEEGGPPRPAMRLSWQSEYDRPELAEYLRIKHPQP